MAKRRMFSLDVIDTDKFLDMPATTQSLYFHLGMRADDDGFVSSPKKVAVLANCSADDLKLLATKGYIIPFQSGVIVLTHWKQHNYIQSDRYRKTLYTEEREQLELFENVYRMDTTSIRDEDKMEAQYRLSKDIVRDKLGEDNKLDYANSSKPKAKKVELSGILLPLNDNSTYDVPMEKIIMWETTYPGVDVKKELQKMIAWLSSNPTRRKTRRGIDRFINSWLSREQDKGGSYRATVQQDNQPSSSYGEYKKMYEILTDEPDGPFQ